MENSFKLEVPGIDGQPMNRELKIGDVMYLLGANGTGKSSLVSRIFNRHNANAKRISAHRQTWFESNTMDITPRARLDLENNTRSQDAQAQARYREWNPAGRANIAIYDLIDADTMQDRKIASLLRNDEDAAAKAQAKLPTPIQEINRLMKLSNLPIEISVEEGQRVIAKRNGSPGYSVAELSDGERNAFLIGASVLTAKPGTLILIDEPERHLHRSIISPLLKLLFDKRKDCAFIVSTHELMLPIDTPTATTLLVRGCEYHGQDVRAWSVDVVPPGAPIDEDLKLDLLGARRKMLFVEGTAQSLDMPLYSLLFPQVSVIPKEGCRDVEYAVRGLKGAFDIHWIDAWGIVDNDQRSTDDISRLRSSNIWALSHYSVESYYYHPAIIRWIAARNSKLTGDDAAALAKVAIENGVTAAKAAREHLVTSAVLRSAREAAMRGLPSRKDIRSGKPMNITVDVAAQRDAEERKFDLLITSSDWDGLLTRYPLRESSAFTRVVEGLKVADQTTYRDAVLKLLEEEPDAVAELRGLLGDLYASITG